MYGTRPAKPPVSVRGPMIFVRRVPHFLIDAGASPKDVQSHIGHESVETTMRWYARVRPGRSEDLAARLNTLIAEVAQGS